MHRLPRLPRPYYQAFAVVHWTITLRHRTTGWLDDGFHALFRELLLHAAAREGLFCPAYVLMPDHIHLIWTGMELKSDQVNAMRFLRKFLQSEFSRRKQERRESIELQKQTHESVLRKKERKRGAFAATCSYLLNNPVRAGLMADLRDWKHTGAVIPGYPDLHPLSEKFWPGFWKLYQAQREPGNPPPLPPLWIPGSRPPWVPLDRWQCLFFGGEQRALKGKVRHSDEMPLQGGV